MNDLPINKIIPELEAALASAPGAVLQAEPGAGKTTRVPLVLLEAPWLAGQKILMLEPRRLAAQTAARFMAKTRNEKVGEIVGYRIRGDAKISAHTRIEVVTEGILTRMLQSDPALEEVGLVIFDEFHERSIHSDTGLALILESQRTLRPDLKLLVMSATLDGAAVAKLMGDVPLLNCPGRSYPVDVTYLGDDKREKIEFAIERAVAQALRETEGDLLVFLPGKAEIQRCFQRLQQRKECAECLVLPLSSEQSEAEQARALTPAPQGKRKIILATSIAETSLTIDGVRTVIDCGLMRVPRFDPRRGMTSLDTVSVSQASAEQRKGRAGRQAAGRCYRLWNEGEQAQLPRFNTPEILQADLVPLALDLAQWGIGQGAGQLETVAFLDAPPAAALSQARSLLIGLGALDADFKITAHGRSMAALNTHPRLAHMLIQAKAIGKAALGCDVAALLEERDLLQGQKNDVDLSRRWQVLADFRRGEKSAERTSTGLLHRVEQQSQRLRNALSVSKAATECMGLGVLAAFAYPERIAQQRGGKGHYLLRSGAGAALPDFSMLSREPYLTVVYLDGKGAHARIFLAEPLSEEDIYQHFTAEISEKREVSWSANNSVVGRETDSLGAITLSEKLFEPKQEEIASLLIAELSKRGVASFEWSETAESLRARSEWLRLSGFAPSEWPDLGDEYLNANLENWCAPFLTQVRSLAQFQKLDLTQALQSLFNSSQLRLLQQLTPSHYILPTGTQAKIHYDKGQHPQISVMLQEMFGASETPKIVDGKVALVVELLSPAKRPLQVTRDLKSFWANAYREVRKEMIGRYPKHVWPEDPANAQPTRRAKPRR